MARDRDSVIVGMFCRGLTYQEIGDLYGVTRQRIEQIIRRNGIKADQGGQALRSFIRISQKMKERKARVEQKRQAWEKKLGCSWDVILSINGVPPVERREKGASKIPVCAYISQKNNAGLRGIEWNISLPDWWRIWQESGKWNLRGRGKGYCMSRYGDSGAYEVGNVYICTIGQNFSDSYIVYPYKDRLRKNKRFLSSKGFSKVGNRFIVVAARKYVGTFNSALAARRAYLKARRIEYGI